MTALDLTGADPFLCPSRRGRVQMHVVALYAGGEARTPACAEALSSGGVAVAVGDPVALMPGRVEGEGSGNRIRLAKTGGDGVYAGVWWCRR